MKSSLGRKILVNAASNWVTYVTSMAITFFVAPVLVQGLGVRRYGVWALVESILSYLSLLDMGIAASVLRYVASYEAQRDHTNINKVFNTSLALFTAAGLVAMGIAGGVAYAALPHFNIPAQYMGEARLLLLLLGANFAINLPLGVFPSVLDGLARYPAKNTVRTLSAIARVPFVFAIVQGRDPLIRLALLTLVFNVVENLLHGVVARFYLPPLRLSIRAVSWSTYRTIRGYSVDALVAMLSNRVSFQTDAIVIGAFVPGTEFIAYFAIASKLVEYSKTGLGTFISVLTPSISAMQARGDTAGIRNIHLKATRYVLFMILPVQVGLVLLGRSFLNLWQGRNFAASSYPVLVILAAPLAFAVSQNVSIRTLYGIGQIRWFSRSSAIQAVANLAISAALASTWGIQGVAFGTALPNMLFVLFIALYACRLLGTPPTVYFRAAFTKPLAAALVLAIVWGTAVVSYPPARWSQWLAIGCVGMAIYVPVAAVLEFGFRTVIARLEATFGWRESLGAGVSESVTK